MEEKIKTSISINPYYKKRLCQIQTVLGESYEDIIKKLLYLFLKGMNNYYLVKKSSRTYQPKGTGCRPFTISYTQEEYEFILNIGNITRTSISYLITMAIECFGVKVEEKAGKSGKALYLIKKLFTKSLKQNFSCSYGKFGLNRGIFIKNNWRFFYYPFYDYLL
jgi:hypothetical protein